MNKLQTENSSSPASIPQFITFSLQLFLSYERNYKWISFIPKNNFKQISVCIALILLIKLTHLWLFNYATYLWLVLCQHFAQQTIFLCQMLRQSLCEGIHVVYNEDITRGGFLFIAVDEGIEDAEIIGASLPNMFDSSEAFHGNFSRAWNVGIVFCKISYSV